MSLWNQFLWVVFPYLTLTVFIVGHLYRYANDPYGWTAKSSEILEKDRLKWGSLLFHWGIIFVLLGHVGGLIVPIQVHEALGISEVAYHLLAVIMGGLSGIAALVGLVLLTFRRLDIRRIRETSTTSDLIALGLLLVVVVLGLANTLGYSLLVGFHDYRLTIGPWLRGILLFRPNATLMTQVPLSFKVHVLAAFGLTGLWPFTRLVHIWSIPLEYLGRSPVLYRSRNPK